MPWIVPALAAGIASSFAVSITTATVIANVVVIAAQLAVSLAISAIAGAVGGGGGAPATGRANLQQKRQQQTVSSRNPIAPRELVFGKIRKGGTIVFIGTTNDGNDLHLVVALAGHKVNAIKEIYFNEDLAFDADGKVDPKYDTQAFVTKYLGTDDQLADPDLITRLVDGNYGSIIEATQTNPVVLTTDGPHRMITGDNTYIQDVQGMVEINDRYYRVDVADEIEGVITAATVANPVVITNVAHGLVTGNSIVINDVVGMIELNDREFVVTKLTDDTFELDDEDGGDHETYISGGTWEKLSEQFSLRDEDGTAYTAYDGLTGTITGATQADPVVITNVAHGLSTDDTIFVTGVEGMIEINDRKFVITRIDDDSFELNNEDGLLHTLYTTGGSWTRWTGRWERRPWTDQHHHPTVTSFS